MGLSLIHLVQTTVSKYLESVQTALAIVFECIIHPSVFARMLWHELSNWALPILTLVPFWKYKIYLVPKGIWIAVLGVFYSRDLKARSVMICPTSTLLNSYTTCKQRVFSSNLFEARDNFNYFHEVLFWNDIKWWLKCNVFSWHIVTRRSNLLRHFELSCQWCRFKTRNAIVDAT